MKSMERLPMQMQNFLKKVINSAIVSIPSVLKVKSRGGTANKRSEVTIVNTITPLLFFNLYQAM